MCELHGLETGGVWAGPDGNGDLAYLGQFYYLPEAVWDWAEMPTTREIDIMDLDRRGLTFVQIAALIEAYL